MPVATSSARAARLNEAGAHYESIANRMRTRRSPGNAGTRFRFCSDGLRSESNGVGGWRSRARDGFSSYDILGPGPSLWRRLRRCFFSGLTEQIPAIQRVLIASVAAFASDGLLIVNVTSQIRTL